jgi:hypothetical protein
VKCNVRRPRPLTNAMLPPHWLHFKKSGEQVTLQASTPTWQSASLSRVATRYLQYFSRVPKIRSARLGPSESSELSPSVVQR